MPVLLGHLWALPTSLLGVILGVVGGARPVRLDGPEQAWVWHVGRGLLRWWWDRQVLGPGGAHVGAQTLGGVILVEPGCDPVLLTHERCHVRQAFWLGPLYLPTYFLSCALAWLEGGSAYADCWMERQAELAAEENP